MAALYEQRINLRDFDEVAPLIDRNAVFWFDDGSHVGLDAIRAAFERTWANLVNETYWLEDLEWLVSADIAAACTYRFYWKAGIDGEPRSGTGRGTTVLRRFDDGWKIVHEHLSANPA